MDNVKLQQSNNKIWPIQNLQTNTLNDLEFNIMIFKWTTDMSSSVRTAITSGTGINSYKMHKIYFYKPNQIVIYRYQKCFGWFFFLRTIIPDCP